MYLHNEHTKDNANSAQQQWRAQQHRLLQPHDERHSSGAVQEPCTSGCACSNEDSNNDNIKLSQQFPAIFTLKAMQEALESLRV